MADSGTVYQVIVVVDSDRKVTRDYARKTRAASSYDKQIALYGLGALKPRASGYIEIRSITDGWKYNTIDRVDWKPGYGWH